MTRPSVLSNPGYCFRLRPRVEEDPLSFRHLPMLRADGYGHGATGKIFFTLPMPRGRLDQLYRMCVNAYAEFGKDALHPRFREVYDSFMDELIISQLSGFNIKGYIQLCAEDLFERDIFAKRRRNLKPNT